MIDFAVLADRFRHGEYDHRVDDAAWPMVFEYLVANANSLAFDKRKVHTLWTVNGGHLRRKIKNDLLVLALLRVALPGYIGPGLPVYRGECQFLFDGGQLGFCWSSDIEMASRFAQGLNALDSGGVLLEAFAPEAAILAGPNRHSREQMQENEYTCDPSLLVNIQVVGLFPKPN